MSVDFSVILDHPLKDEIISKLVSGVAPREISEWLRLKFPEKEQKHLVLSIKVLRDFAESEWKNYYNYLTTTIDNVKSPADIQSLPSSLAKNKTLKDRLTEYVDEKIDINKEYLKLHIMITDRMEQIFDLIQQNPGNVNGRQEYVLIKWVEQIQALLTNYNKNVNQAPDQIIQHNYTVQYVDQQAMAMQNAIKNVLDELDPEISFRIYDKISEEMAKINPLDSRKSIIPSHNTQKEKIYELQDTFQQNLDNLNSENDE